VVSAVDLDCGSSDWSDASDIDVQSETHRQAERNYVDAVDAELALLEEGLKLVCLSAEAEVAQLESNTHMIQKECDRIASALQGRATQVRSLVVGSFPGDARKDQLRDVFSVFGELESVYVVMRNSNRVYGFVNFVRPEAAARALAACSAGMVTMWDKWGMECRVGAEFQQGAPKKRKNKRQRERDRERMEQGSAQADEDVSTPSSASSTDVGSQWTPTSASS
jgi:hypothetical protein